LSGQWFSLGTPVSSTNKTDHHDIAELLLEVAFNTITIKIWIIDLPFIYIYIYIMVYIHNDTFPIKSAFLPLSESGNASIPTFDLFSQQTVSTKLWYKPIIYFNGTVIVLKLLCNWFDRHVTRETSRFWNFPSWCCVDMQQIFVQCSHFHINILVFFVGLSLIVLCYLCEFFFFTLSRSFTCFHNHDNIVQSSYFAIWYRPCYTFVFCRFIFLVNFRKNGELQKSKKRLFSDQSNIRYILETIPVRV
jgi:hypothetical protein